MGWGTAIKIIGSLAKKAEPLVKSSRKMPPPRIQGPIPRNKPGRVTTQVATISKESKAIGTNAINHYNDILKQIPECPLKNELLADLEAKVWGKINVPQREKLDEAIQELLKRDQDIRKGINARGITAISQIKPYGYWIVKLPQGEIKFGLSYPALLKLSEKLTPIEKSKFLSALEEALRLPLKPGDSPKITDSIKLTFDKEKDLKEITVMLGNLKLEGSLWKDGVYTIDTIVGI